MGRRSKYDQLPGLATGVKPKVLLIGNGINLAFEKKASTGKSKKTSTPGIVMEEWEKHYGFEADDANPIWGLPFPMQITAATKNHVQGCMTALARTFKASATKADQEKLIKEIIDTPFDTILSTNYSLEFEKSTIPEYTDRKAMMRYKVTDTQTTVQHQFGIFQCTELPYGNKPSLWHIHGTALRKNSMVMGHHYYGKLLTEVTKRADEVNKQYKAAQTRGNTYYPLSWIDYFLIGDVYIFGFRLDISESDIWWLLSYKKSTFTDTNVYLYEPKIKPDKKLLLDCYSVITPSIPIYKNADGEDNYINYYQRILGLIKSGNPIGP